MKNILILLFTLLIGYSMALGQGKTEVLTNESIIEICKSGLPSSIVITKIKKTKSSFKTDTDDLIHLKKSGVPDDVISSMIDVSYSDISDSGDKTNPLEHQKSGIYLFSKNKQALVELEPAVTSQGHSGMMGFGKSGQSAKINGTTARTQTSEKEPGFYFYFDGTSDINSPGHMFSGSTNPGEFILVKFTSNGKARGMVTMSFSPFGGAQMGVPDKQQIPFEYEKMETGIYKVYPSQALSTGEYCFMHTNESRRAFIGAKVYDFGINNIGYKSIEANGQKKFEVYDVRDPAVKSAVTNFIGYEKFKDNNQEYTTKIIYNRNSIITTSVKGKSVSSGKEFKRIRSLNTSTQQPLLFKDVFDKKYVGDIKGLMYNELSKMKCDKPKKFDLYNSPISVDNAWFYIYKDCNCGYPECEDLEMPVRIPFHKIDQFVFREGIMAK